MAKNDDKRDRRERARAAMEQRGQEKRPQFETVVGDDPWSSVLAELDAMVMPRLAKVAAKLSRYPSAFPEAARLIKEGTMRRSPASEADLESAEKRLGLELPPSYRSFLLASNGLLLPAYCAFCAVDEVIPYAEADPDGAEMMAEFAQDFPELEDVADQGDWDETAFRPGNATHSLALNRAIDESAAVASDFGWCLLVRNTRQDSGEYEIWIQAYESHRRFQSFAAYFAERRNWIGAALDWLDS